MSTPYASALCEEIANEMSGVGEGGGEGEAKGRGACTCLLQYHVSYF